MEVKCGDMTFRYTHQGASLEIFDIPVMSNSSLWVITPDWKTKYYMVGAQKDLFEKISVEDVENGKKITIPHEMPPEYDCPFQGTQTFILTEDNAITCKLEFTFKRDLPAAFEWGLGNVNPFLFIGKPFTAKDDHHTTNGIVPVVAESGNVAESALARDFKELNIDSRIGRFKIESDPGQDLLLFDYRKNRWADKANPCFWLGFMDQQIPKRGRYTRSVILRFDKEASFDSKTVKSLSGEVNLIPVDDALHPGERSNVIIPTPKKLEWTTGTFELSSETGIFLISGHPERSEKSLVLLLEDLRDKYGIEPEIFKKKPGEVTFPENSMILQISGEESEKPPPYFPEDMKFPDHQEGYVIRVQDKNVFAASQTDRGMFYALSTLLQMIRMTDDGVVIRGAEIEDYPAMDFRGIHCLTGKDAGDQIAKAVRNLMARFKINILVFECEYLKWDSHPEIHHPSFGMDKDDARKVLDSAGRYFVEIIPMISSLGHMNWAFQNDQHLDLAEDPVTPYAYSPTNPDSYRFIFSVYEEAIEFFKPRHMHIGHDEVTMLGRFPYLSRDTGKTAGELIVEDIIKLNNWLKERNVGAMIWGDQFLHESECIDACNAPTPEIARKMRDGLPKDVIITDWHYEVGKPEDYKSLKIWNDEGFRVIGAPWFDPENIRNVTQYGIHTGAMGTLQTTWAGFNFKIDDNENLWHQYWAYILAAYYSWTGENTDSEELPFDVRDVFLDQWFDYETVLKKSPGFTCDLTPFYNRRLDDDKGTGWLGVGPDLDLSSFPCRDGIFNQTRFRIHKNSRGEAAVMMAGKFNPPGEYPEKISIPLHEKQVSEIHFLMTGGWRSPDGKNLGEISFIYEGEEKESVPLVYGKNLFAFDDDGVGKNAKIAWEGISNSGEKVSLWDLTWKNPRPENSLKRIEIMSRSNETTPIIIAVTGIY